MSTNPLALHPTTTPTDFLPTTIDALIHQDYSQDFKALELPAEGLFIAVRTWDFGPFPPAWVRRINAECDQLWVYSRWTRAQAIAGGVAPGRVRVIPPGVDPAVFRPDGPACALPTDRRARFLFTGAAVLRKGVDILLSAWLEAFDSGDDVCLVIKDNPRDTFYHGIRLTDRILALAADPAAAPVLVIDDYLDPADLAALYRACSAGVFPYRAEGFALPILEAMACGLPSIAPRFGACLDYCSDRTSFLVPARHIQLPVDGDFAFNTLGFSETIEAVDFCEVPVPVLAETLRRVAALPPAELAARSAAGVAVAHGRFTWSHSAARILRALGQAQATRTPRRLRRARADARRHQRVFETAKGLYLGISAADGGARPSHSAP